MRSLCGQPEGPIELLALEDHEHVSALFRAGDHWLANVEVYDRSVVPARADTGSEGTGGTTPDDGVVPEVRLLARELHAIDACGDNPRTLFDHVAMLQQHGDRWFACDTYADLTWFDPAGRRAPQQVASCSKHTVVDGDLVVEERDPDGGVGTLVRLSLAEGREPEQKWAVDGKFVRSWAPPDHPRLIARYGASVFQIDPETGATEAIVDLEPLEDAFVYDGRFVAIEAVEAVGEAGYRVWDRDTGETVELPAPIDSIDDGLGSLDWTYAGTGFLAVRRYEASVAVWLPELVVQPLPDGAAVLARFDDVMVVSVGFDTIDVIDGPGAAPRRLAGNLSHIYAIEAEGIVAERWPDLVSIPLDGGPATTLAHQVLEPQRLTDDRWASLDVTDGVRSLVVVDGGGDRLGTIDEGLADFAWPDFRPDALHPADGVVYRIDAPERRGIWYAELP